MTPPPASPASPRLPPVYPPSRPRLPPPLPNACACRLLGAPAINPHPLTLSTITITSPSPSPSPCRSPPVALTPLSHPSLSPLSLTSFTLTSFTLTLHPHPPPSPPSPSPSTLTLHPHQPWIQDASKGGVYHVFTAAGVYHNVQRLTRRGSSRHVGAVNADPHPP